MHSIVSDYFNPPYLSKMIYNNVCIVIFDKIAMVFNESLKVLCVWDWETYTYTLKNGHTISLTDGHYFPSETNGRNGLTPIFRTSITVLPPADGVVIPNCLKNNYKSFCYSHHYNIFLDLKRYRFHGVSSLFHPYDRTGLNSVLMV